MAVKKGNKIKVEYTGTLDDGSVFDSSEKHGAPLEFEVGSGQIIIGFENAVIGMKKGDEKKIKLKPSEAYGEANPQLVKQVPKAQLPQTEELKTGMILGVKLPNGMQVPARITKITDETVTIDFNHPLAGKTLNFKIKVVDIAA